MKLPPEFLKLCKAVKAKRPRTVITHILKHGFITTQDLKDKYGYNLVTCCSRRCGGQSCPFADFVGESVSHVLHPFGEE